MEGEIFRSFLYCSLFFLVFLFFLRYFVFMISPPVRFGLFILSHVSHGESRFLSTRIVLRSSCFSDFAFQHFHPYLSEDVYATQSSPGAAKNIAWRLRHFLLFDMMQVSLASILLLPK